MEEETELDLRELFQIIRKRISLIIIITLITTLITAIVSVFIISPTYEAKVGFIIGKQSNGEKITSSDVTMYQSLMQTYKDIAETNKVAEMTAAKLGNNTDSKSLLDHTVVTVKSGTMVINIAMQNSSQTEAYKEIQAYAEAFTQRATELIPDGDVKILDNAQMPESPVKPKVAMNIAIGFLLGLLVSVGLAFLMEYMNNTIRTKEDVEKYLGLSVIGIIAENDEE